MSKSNKVKTIWKTKEVGGKLKMICQNSNPETSMYPEWGPEDGVCDTWSDVGHDTSAVTCWKCAQRSLKV